MHPVIFQTKFFTLHTFWLFMGIAIITFGILLTKLSIKNNLKLQFLSQQSWKLILATLISSRIFSVIENFQSYFYEINIQNFFKIFHIWDKGLNGWGAIFGFLITFYFLSNKHGRNFWRWIDILIPSMIIALGIGSLGAFFDGINYGHETSLPWGVNFESPTIKYTVPIHPTQIYAFIYSMIIGISFIYITIHYKTKIKDKNLEGIMGISGVTVYSLLFFLEQFLRGDDAWMILGIRVEQIAALLVTILTGIFLYLRYNKPEKNTQESKEQS